jgi:hypothetical protein
VAGVKPTQVSIFYYFSTHLLFFFNYFFHSPTQTHAILLSLLFRLTLPHPLSLSLSLSPSRPLSDPLSHCGHRRPPSLSLALTPAQGFRPLEKKLGFALPPLLRRRHLSPCLPIRESTEPSTHPQVFFG